MPCCWSQAGWRMSLRRTRACNSRIRSREHPPSQNPNRAAVCRLGELLELSSLSSSSSSLLYATSCSGFCFPRSSEGAGAASEAVDSVEAAGLEEAADSAALGGAVLAGGGAG